MWRKGHFVFVAVAGVTLAAALADEAAAAIRGGGFRLGQQFGRWQQQYSYGGVYAPYGYGAGLTAASTYVASVPIAPVAPPSLALTCKHSQEVVTVPMENGTGTQQIRITRC
jgi:hypothetical protein